MTATMVRPALTAAVRRALHALGADAGDIARTLYNAGFHGHRGCSARCPIAQYLAARLSADQVVVCGQWVNVYRGHEHVEIATPDSVTAFLMIFDQGRFPKLDRGSHPGLWCPDDDAA